MFYDLVAAVSAGMGLAGLAMMLRHLSRRRLASWIVPAAAGAGMLAFAIWSEYAWYPRTVAALPEGVVVARATETRAPWRPWTYLRPIVTRFSAVDARAPRINPGRPGEVLVPVLLVGRWSASATIPVVFDCEGRRMAALSGDAELPGPGLPEPQWTDLPEGDEALAAACAT